MQKMGAERVLESLIELLTEYIEELLDYKDVAGAQFQYGERVAYTECLERIRRWEDAEKYGLDYEIEKRYPL